MKNLVPVSILADCFDEDKNPNYQIFNWFVEKQTQPFVHGATDFGQKKLWYRVQVT